MPAADIAAAIAVLAQDGEPLFLEDMPEPRAARSAASDGETGGQPGRAGGSRSASGTASSRARSSARSPTRAACSAPTSAGSTSSRTSRSSSCPPDLSPETLDKLAGHPHLRGPDRPPARQGPAPRSGPPEALRRPLDGDRRRPSGCEEAATPEGLTPERRVLPRAGVVDLGRRLPGGTRAPHPVRPASLLVAAGLALAAAARLAAADEYPVSYNFLSSAVLAGTQVDADPPGANDWNCKPTAAAPAARWCSCTARPATRTPTGRPTRRCWPTTATASSR